MNSSIQHPQQRRRPIRDVVVHGCVLVLAVGVLAVLWQPIGVECGPFGDKKKKEDEEEKKRREEEKRQRDEVARREKMLQDAYGELLDDGPKKNESDKEPRELTRKGLLKKTKGQQAGSETPTTSGAGSSNADPNAKAHKILGMSDADIKRSKSETDLSGKGDKKDKKKGGGGFFGKSKAKSEPNLSSKGGTEEGINLKNNDEQELIHHCS